MDSLTPIREVLSQNKLDAFFISDPVNASYLSGSEIAESSLLVSGRDCLLFTDPRYQEQASRRARGLKVVVMRDAAGKDLIEKLKKYRRLGFEAEDMTYSRYIRLRKELKHTRLIPLKGIVQSHRKIKTAREIGIIRSSAAIAASALRSTREMIRKGVTERQLGASLEFELKRLTASGPSFATIVASGPNSSKPHAALTDRKIRGNDIILVDAGCDFKGYKSDLTRVFFSGKINRIFRKIYGIVLKAQDTAISKVRPGVKISEIDKAARDAIAAHGYGKNFLHATGHGIGRQVHEQPYVSIKNQEILLPGMVFTVEPAVYFPGRFGIRIEDMVLVTDKGCEVLTDDIDKSI